MALPDNSIRTSTIETFGEQFVNELSSLISNGVVKSLGHGQGLCTASSSISIKVPSIQLINEYFQKWSDFEIHAFMCRAVKSPELNVYQVDCKEFIANLKFIASATQFHMVCSTCPNMLALACPILWPMIIGDYIKAKMMLKRLIRDKCITLHVVFSQKQR